MKIDELETVNATVKGHPFHPRTGFPATVTHKVHWEDSDLRYTVTGEGDGPFPLINNVVGVPLFLRSSVWTLWKAQYRLAQGVNVAGPEP